MPFFTLLCFCIKYDLMSNVLCRVLGGTLIVNYTKIGPKDKNVQKN